jgi:hypothetical protein
MARGGLVICRMRAAFCCEPLLEGQAGVGHDVLRDPKCIRATTSSTLVRLKASLS